MNSSQTHPRPRDLVLGGHPPLKSKRSLVLGGIEGLKKRLFHSNEVERLETLADTLQYGDVGLDLLRSSLHDPSLLVQWEAFNYLRERPEPDLQALLQNWLPVLEYTTIRHNGNDNQTIPAQARHFIEPFGIGKDYVASPLTMIAIPPGQVLMGSPESEPMRAYNEGPQQRVTVSPFFMAQTPITQAQWYAVSQLPKVNTPLMSNPSTFSGDSHPVESISWYDAVEFCDRLTRETGNDYRLPTEAEWEYACRAGTETPFYWGETMPHDLGTFLRPENQRNQWSRAVRVGGERVVRKGTASLETEAIANGFGLYDMHGNIWEWCMDHDHATYVGLPEDGTAWVSGQADSKRILRGGSWRNDLSYCRSATRSGDYADIRDDNIGFRVVCSARNQ